VSIKKSLRDTKRPNLGERIQRVMDACKLKQGPFAESLGIRQGYLSEIINGKKTPSDTLLGLISVKYNYSLRWLKTGEGDTPLLPPSEAVNEDPHEYGSSAQNLHQKTLESGIPNSVVSGDSETLSPEDIEMRDELIRELRDSRDEWKARALKAERKLEQIETNQNSKTG